MVTLYGIRNCDTIKKARRWLDEHEVDYRFHDFRGDGLSRSTAEKWLKELGWEALINRRGTTWRSLPEDTRENINRTSALKLMLTNPAIIKRPILDLGNTRVAGFDPARYLALFSGQVKS